MSNTLIGETVDCILDIFHYNDNNKLIMVIFLAPYNQNIAPKRFILNVHKRDMTKHRMCSHETKGKVLILVFKNYNGKDMDIIKFLQSYKYM